MLHLRRMSPIKGPKRFRVILVRESTVVLHGELDFPLETSQPYNASSHKDFQHWPKSSPLALQCLGLYLKGFRFFKQFVLVLKTKQPTMPAWPSPSESAQKSARTRWQQFSPEIVVIHTTQERHLKLFVLLNNCLQILLHLTKSWTFYPANVSSLWYIKNRKFQHWLPNQRYFWICSS